MRPASLASPPVSPRRADAGRLRANFTAFEDDGTTAADQTFKALTDAIEKLSGGVKYAWLDIAPKNNEDGGQPGASAPPLARPVSCRAHC